MRGTVGNGRIDGGCLHSGGVLRFRSHKSAFVASVGIVSVLEAVRPCSGWCLWVTRESCVDPFVQKSCEGGRLEILW